MSIKLLRSSFESIRSRFQKLADDGYDPRVSFVTLTKPVWKGDGDIGDVPPIKSRTVDFYHESKQVCYYNEVSRRGLYAVDWGWELSGRIGDPRAWSSLNTEIGESWTRRMAGWIVSDNSTTVPHCERWQYVFLAKQQFPPFEKVCTDAATLIGSVFPSPIVKLAFGPNVPVNAVIFQNSGLWRDVVLLIGLQRLPGVMLTANAVAMDKYLYPISAMVPGEWTQPQQPPVWISHIDNFAAASIFAVDVLMNWLDELEAEPQPAAGVTGEAKQVEVAAEQITIIEQVPTLSDKQYLILEWMLSNGSISSENRTNNKEISLGVDGNLASEQAFKVPLAELRKTHELIDSKTGRGGGCWLTPKGIAIAKMLFANREAIKKQ